MLPGAVDHDISHGCRQPEGGTLGQVEPFVISAVESNPSSVGSNNRSAIVAYVTRGDLSLSLISRLIKWLSPWPGGYGLCSTRRIPLDCVCAHSTSRHRACNQPFPR